MLEEGIQNKGLTASCREVCSHRFQIWCGSDFWLLDPVHPNRVCTTVFTFVFTFVIPVKGWLGFRYLGTNSTLVPISLDIFTP